MKKVLAALTATALLGLAGCAGVEAKDASKSAPKAATEMTAADKAIAMAEEELATAKKAGHEWKLVDKATGSRSASLSKLLAAAKKARDNGDDAEAIRIANRITENAKLGQQQAKEQANVGPTYPK